MVRPKSVNPASARESALDPSPELLDLGILDVLDVSFRSGRNRQEDHPAFAVGLDRAGFTRILAWFISGLL